MSGLGRLALLIGAMGMLGPFSIDTLFPAFGALETDFGAPHWQVQQTLSVYLACFALMSLVHGPLSDRYGRRRVLLVNLGVFIAASIGCLLATSLPMLLAFRALQGLSAGAGTIIGRAIVRDSASGPEAQRLMSQITLVFAIAPAIAPIIGGWIHLGFGWRAIFGFITAFGAAVWLACKVALPETLPPDQRLRVRPLSMARAYSHMLGNLPSLMLICAAAFNFSGLFLYISSAPQVVEQMLGLRSTQYHWLFLPMIGAILLGSQISGRMAGKVAPFQLMAIAYAIMAGTCTLNLLLLWGLPTPGWAQTILPAALYGIGSSLAFPTLTLKLLDRYPLERGTAASMQAFIGLSVNALAAGVLSPWLARGPHTLAIGQAVLMLLGLGCWLVYRGRVHED